MTADGRELAFAVWGDCAGFPVVGLHGTPGSRLERWPDEELYRRLGVCFVTYDRAGYGRSTRRRGRRIADEAGEIRLLADELGFERFAVAGGSGGGPPALACASLLGDRVVRVACSVAPAPFGSPGLEPDAWFAGMDPENVKEFGWALAGEDVLAVELEREHAAMRQRFAADPATILGDFELSESDRAQVARPEFIQIMRWSLAEQAVHGVWGWVDDDLAGIRPWGFAVETISVPVLVRYGMTDVLVPPSHGAWLAAHVPGCVVKIDDVAGHLSPDPEQRISEIIRWLRDGVPPPGSR